MESEINTTKGRMNSRHHAYVLRDLPPRPSDDLAPDPTPTADVDTHKPCGLDQLHPKDAKHVLYAAQVFVRTYQRKHAEGFSAENEVVRSSVNTALEKALEDLVLSWLDSRGLRARHSGERFMSLKTLLMEGLSFAQGHVLPHEEDKLRNYAEMAEYRNLAHTLRVTPTGAVRSATQERLIQILEKLGANA